MPKLRYAALVLAVLAAAPSVLFSAAYACRAGAPECRRGGSDSGGGLSSPSTDVKPANCSKMVDCGP